MDTVLRYDEVNKTNMRDSLTTAHGRSDRFSFMIIVYPTHDNKKCKHIWINNWACIKTPLDAYGIDARIYNQIINTSNYPIVHLVDL